MLNSISWQDFLTTLAISAGSYYGITTLLLFSEEIKSFFMQKQSNAIAAEELEDQSDSNENIDLMGGTKQESKANVSHEIIVEPEEINVTQSAQAEESIEWNDSLLGAFKNLQNEIEIIAGGLSPENKDENILLFRSLLSRYPQLIETHFEEKVNLFICDLLHEKCSIQFEPNKIKSWWIETEVPTDINQ